MVGQCLSVPGITREGVSRGPADPYRAHAPVVFFPDVGGPGRLVSSLPVRPLRMAGATLDARPVLFAVDLAGVSAFDLTTPAQPRLLARATFVTAATVVTDAGVVGTDLAIARDGAVLLYPLAGLFAGTLGAPRSLPVDVSSYLSAFSSGAIVWTWPLIPDDPDASPTTSMLATLDPATGVETDTVPRTPTPTRGSRGCPAPSTRRSRTASRSASR